MGPGFKNFAKKLTVASAFTAVVGTGAIALNNSVGPFTFGPDESGTAYGRIADGSAFSKSNGSPGCTTIWGGTLNLGKEGKTGFMPYFTENADLARKLESGSPVTVKYDSSATSLNACDVSIGMRITDVQPG